MENNKFICNFTRLLIDYIDQEITIIDLESYFHSVCSINNIDYYSQLPLAEPNEDRISGWSIIPSTCCTNTGGSWHGHEDEFIKALPAYKKEIEGNIAKYITIIMPKLAPTFDNVLQQICTYPTYWQDYCNEVQRLMQDNIPFKDMASSLHFWKDAIPNEVLDNSFLLLQCLYLSRKSPFKIDLVLPIQLKETILTHN